MKQMDKGKRKSKLCHYRKLPNYKDEQEQEKKEQRMHETTRNKREQRGYAVFFNNKFTNGFDSPIKKDKTVNNT